MNHILYIAIFAFYFAMQIGISLTYDPDLLIAKSSDFGTYYQTALSVMQGHGFSNVDGTPYIWSGPGYPAFIAAMMWLFGDLWVREAVIFQMIALAVTGYTLYQFVHPVACILLLFNPNSFLAVHSLQTETLFTMFLTLFLFHGLRGSVIIAGIAGGLMALTRPVGYYLLFLFPVMLWLSKKQSSFSS